MDIYKNKSSWKWFLAIVGLAIVIPSMVYSHYLAENLKERERQTAVLYSDAINSAATKNENEDTGMELSILDQLSNVPIIMENEQGILTGYNYGEDIISDQELLNEKKAKILENGNPPIQGFGSSHKIYVENSLLYKRISLFPYVQILLLSSFVLIGYYIFSTSRRAEQNRVWAGMAKETAHQLGTPISAILGWIEHLKESASGNEEQIEIVQELRNDVTRLELVADRFSKIGSMPELENINLLDELQSCRTYMERRAPKKVKFDFPDPKSQPVRVNINSHLFNWVVENLLRNALDSMESTGTITARIETNNKFAILDITDTGKGISSGNFKTIFEPGFTTKKRGWGLGLSLAKRIIEEYHRGKIFVKNSKPNVGTTFTIQLPLA